MRAQKFRGLIGRPRSEDIPSMDRIFSALRRQFARLRKDTHRSMKDEEKLRLRENPAPTEEELYMGAFKEWLEPQVRAAVLEMNRKGYATQSSGFHCTRCELQMIDGLFTIDGETKNMLEHIGVEVLRGADIGLAKNDFITILQFRAQHPSISAIADKWNSVAAVFPQKSFPPGIRPICVRAEHFRQQYAPDQPSLQKAREAYLEYLHKITG
jgi:hypothetical protein